MKKNNIEVKNDLTDIAGVLRLAGHSSVKSKNCLGKFISRLETE